MHQLDVPAAPLPSMQEQPHSLTSEETGQIRVWHQILEASFSSISIGSQRKKDLLSPVQLYLVSACISVLL